jgi:hypothetical protein
MAIPELGSFLTPPELIENSSNDFLKWHANLLCRGAFNATWSESILKTAIDLAIKVSAFFLAAIGTMATFGFYASWLIDQAKNRELEVKLRSLEKTLSESQENCKNLEKEKTELKNKNASLEASLEEHKKLEEDHKLLLKNISNSLQSIKPSIPGVLTIDQLIDKLKDLQTWIGQYVSLEKKCKNLEQRNANWEKTAVELIRITGEELKNDPRANFGKVKTLADLRMINGIQYQCKDQPNNQDPFFVEARVKKLIRKLLRESGRKSNVPLLPLSRPISEEGNEE